MKVLSFFPPKTKANPQEPRRVAESTCGLTVFVSQEKTGTQPRLQAVRGPELGLGSALEPTQVSRALLFTNI